MTESTFLVLFFEKSHQWLFWSLFFCQWLFWGEMKTFQWQKVKLMQKGCRPMVYKFNEMKFISPYQSLVLMYENNNSNIIPFIHIESFYFFSSISSFSVDQALKQFWKLCLLNGYGIKTNWLNQETILWKPWAKPLKNPHNVTRT